MMKTRDMAPFKITGLPHIVRGKNAKVRVMNLRFVDFKSILHSWQLKVIVSGFIFDYLKLIPRWHVGNVENFSRGY